MFLISHRSRELGIWEQLSYVAWLRRILEAAVKLLAGPVNSEDLTEAGGLISKMAYSCHFDRMPSDPHHMGLSIDHSVTLIRGS